MSQEPIKGMFSVDEALSRILTHFERLPSELISSPHGLGRLLAEDVKTLHNVPPFANSAMDGYALRISDVQAASTDNGIKLNVIEDIAAGTPPQKAITNGTAARIMTGAQIPEGADAVVPVESTNEDWRAAGREATPAPQQITIYDSAKSNQHVRPIGEDMPAGKIALTEGSYLRPQEIGMLAALGIPEITVTQQPRIAILSTGNELLPIDAELAPGKIRDVNRYTLSSLVTASGGIPLWLGIATDDPQDVRAHLQSALDQQVHLIISSAGVSVGAYDVVRSVLAELGQVDFWRVRMQPGKPLAFGLISGVPFLGLPGNPVSAMVSYEVFVRPAIFKLSGRIWQPQTIPVVLDEPLHLSGNRQTYMRVALSQSDGRLVASSVGNQGSSLLMSMVRADALLIIPEGIKQTQPGQVFQAILLDNSSTNYPLK